VRGSTTEKRTDLGNDTRQMLADLLVTLAQSGEAASVFDRE
jgi:hypothetical protein